MKLFINHHHPEVPTRLLESLLFFYEDEPDGNYKIQVETCETHRCNLVNIPITDERVYWGKRGGRRTISPLVKAKDLLPEEISYTSTITIIFKKKNDKISIKTCYWGEGNAPCEPQKGIENLQESIEFWSNHALIPDEKIKLGEMPKIYRTL